MKMLAGHARPALGIMLRGHALTASVSVLALFAGGVLGLWFDPSDKVPVDWRKNLLQSSEDFTSTYWSKTFQNGGVAPVVTPDYGAAPDGTMTADRVQFATPNGATAVDRSRLISTGGIVSNEIGMFSVWLKSLTGGPQNLSLLIANNVPLTAEVTTEWQRFALSSAGVTAQLFEIRLHGNIAASADVLVWGAQFNNGAEVLPYQKITAPSETAVLLHPRATLFQEIAGINPASQPGDPVGLALDKSQGLILGPELVVNGDFTAPLSDWVPGGSNPATAEIINGELVVTSVGTSGRQVYGFPTVVGKTYKVSGVGRVISGSTGVSLYQTTNTGNTILGGVVVASGAVGLHFVATAAMSYISAIVLGSAGAVGAFDNISVRELPGYHATQPVAASRPTLARHPKGGRRNQVAQSTSFTKAGTGTLVTTTAYPATGDLWHILGTVASADRAISGTMLIPIGATVTGTIYLDPAQTTEGAQFDVYFGRGGSNRVQLRMTFAEGVFSIGTTTGSAGIITHDSSSCVLQPDGKYKITATATNISGAADNWSMGVWATAATIGTSVALASPQIETGSVATPYQRVTSLYDVTEAGVEDLWFLACDPVDDFLTTPPLPGGVQPGWWIAAAVAFTNYNGATSQIYYLGIGNTATDSLGFRSRYQTESIRQNTAIYRRGGGDQLGVVPGVPPLIGVPFIEDVFDDGTNVFTRMNLNSDAVGFPVPFAGPGPDNTLRIGVAGFGMNFYGMTARLRAPTAAERHQIATFLGGKIGMDVGPLVPLPVAPAPVVINQAAYSAYSNEVTI